MTEQETFAGIPIVNGIDGLAQYLYEKFGILCDQTPKTDPKTINTVHDDDTDFMFRFAEQEQDYQKYLREHGFYFNGEPIPNWRKEVKE